MSSSSSSSSYSSNSSSQHANRTKELPMYDCSKNYKNVDNSGWCGTGWDDDGENHNRSRMDSKLQSAKTTLERSTKPLRLCLLRNTVSKSSEGASIA